jgi:predicted ATPase
MRSIEDVELDLAEPTVLIGPNGAGKSTIIEACELLRKAGSERPFVSKLFDAHGGSAALLRHGAPVLGLDIGLTSKNGIALDYELSLRRSGSWMTVDHERVTASEPGKHPRTLLERHRTDYALDTEASEKHSIGEDDLAIAAAAYRSPELEAIRAALSSIEVHPAPDTRPAWTANANQAELGLRSSNIIRPATRVEPGGRNLPNVYHALRNQSDWQDTLARIQLALGDRVEAVTTPADPSGGRIGLALRIAGVGEVASFAMSDGQLAYLALIGVLRLKRPVVPSLVAFDEPDLHLHPGLVRRLTSDLEVFGRQTTVVVATHSDALLDALAEPARSAVLCDLDDRSATRCLRPDPDELQRWLESYRGLGELRSAGYEETIFPALESP